MTKDVEKKKGILDDAYRRGYDYMPKHSWPCAPAVFAAVMDTLARALFRHFIWSDSTNLYFGA